MATIGVLATMSVILPAFLTGAVAVQIRDDLRLAESAIGVAIGAFFLGSAAGSTALGRLAERLGPSLALRLGLSLTSLAGLAIVVLVDDTPSLAAVLVVAGLANALVQPAINLLVVRLVAPERLGLVMALKQSGMPAAALLGGLAVPAIALTIGWRAAYLGGAVLALASIGQLRVVERRLATGALATGVLAGHQASAGADAQTDEVGGPGVGGAGGKRRPARARPDQGPLVLAVMAAVGVLGGGAANIAVAYLVSGAVAAGVQPGYAGLILMAGSALGIGSRLVHGWLADQGRLEPLSRMVIMLLAGMTGALALTSQQPIAYVLATPVVFAGGWAWPGLFNLVVVRANRSAPAAATGVTQTGVYVGAVVGPIGAGALIEASGYRPAWFLTAAALGLAALATLVVRALMAESSEIEVERPLAPG